MNASPAALAVQRWHRPLLWFAAAMGVLALVAAGGLLVDDRTVVGSPAWLKPFKFAVSLGLYALTLAWLLRACRKGRRTGWWAATVVTVASAGEMVLVTLQAVRGHASHYNIGTPFDAAVWALMGNLVAVLWTASLVVAVVVAVQRDGDPVLRSAARLGFVLSLVGMVLGFLMTMPTAEQRAAAAPGMIGAHSVGVADGGPAMPVTGWSTTGGDLRIPHFVGLHALQALPLLALLLAALAAREPAGRFGSPGARRRVVRVAAAGYAGLLALLTWQALRGQPLLHPDARTLLAAGALAAAVATGTVLVLRAPRPARRSDPAGVAGDAQGVDAVAGVGLGDRV